MRNKIFRMVSLASIGALLGLATTAANAVAITGTIESNGSNYSLIHLGSNPSGSGDRDDWLWFAGSQAFSFDLTGTMVTTSGSQFYTLASNNGASAALEIVSLTADLNGSNGFASGQLQYRLDIQSGSSPLASSTSGMFAFADQQYGGSPFNSSSIDSGMFQAFMWGGDTSNDLGIDFSFSGQVPEPGTLLLLGAGLVGLGVSRKRRNGQTAA